MKLRSMMTLLVFAVIMTFTMTACNNDGGAEKVGKKIDKVFDSAKDKIHDATK